MATLGNLLLFLSLFEFSRCRYYQYNRETGHVLISAGREPVRGFTLLGAPKANRRGQDRDVATPGACPALPFRCRRPYPASETSQFECDADYQCPRGYKCCAQRCFSHRICSAAVREPCRVVSQEDFGMRFDVPTTTTTLDPVRAREYEAYEYHYGDPDDEAEEY